MPNPYDAQFNSLVGGSFDERFAQAKRNPYDDEIEMMQPQAAPVETAVIQPQNTWVPNQPEPERWESATEQPYRNAYGTEFGEIGSMFRPVTGIGAAGVTGIDPSRGAQGVTNPYTPQQMEAISEGIYPTIQVPETDPRRKIDMSWADPDKERAYQFEMSNSERGAPVQMRRETNPKFDEWLQNRPAMRLAREKIAADERIANANRDPMDEFIRTKLGGSSAVPPQGGDVRGAVGGDKPTESQARARYQAQRLSAEEIERKIANLRSNGLLAD